MQLHAEELMQLHAASGADCHGADDGIFTRGLCEVRARDASHVVWLGCGSGGGVCGKKLASIYFMSFFWLLNSFICIYIFIT